MIPESLQQQIQLLEDDGYVVLLKWDGQRKELRKTLVISRTEDDVSIRIDGDDMENMLRSAFTVLKNEDA